MMKLVIIIDLLITMIIFGIIFIYYFKFYGRYMFNLNLEWNKLIEKPRLYFLSILTTIYLTIVCSKYKMYDHEYFELTFYFLSVSSIIISIFIFIFFKDGLIKKIFIHKQIKELNLGTNIDKEYYSLDKTKKIYTEINKKIIEAEIDSFYCFLNRKKLGKKGKIKWLDITGKTNHLRTGSNKKTLYEFIQIAYDIDSDEENFNKQINNIIELYFLNNKKESFKYQDNTSSKTKSSNPKYLEEIRLQFHTLFNV